MSGSPLVIRRRRLLIVGLVFLFLLNIGNAVTVYALFVLDLEFAFGVVPLFNFDTESNFPTFFNGLLLGFASALALGISRSLRHQGEKSSAFSWKAVALVLLFMMIDEMCRVHEALDWILVSRLKTEGAISWPWVIPYFMLAMSVAGFFFRFFLTLQPKYRWCLAGSALLYVTGAIGFELLEAAHTEKHGMDSLGFGILYSIEETLEMLAVMMAIWGFMGYASEHCGELGAGIVVAP